MAQSKIVVGLEIGTSKTCMVVSEVHPDASATIIGLGEVATAGVRKGEIINQSMARQCVCDAWQLAQDNAEVDIMNVYLSVTGEHIYGENNTGSYRLPDDENIICEHHADLACEKAERLMVDAGRFILNRELGGLSVDGGDPIRHPEGMAGRTLDVNCHVIHGTNTRLVNSLYCVNEVSLEVEGMVFAPLATAQVVLSRQQKEAGALLIDIGGGTSDFICYKGGDVVASGCIPVGGNTINSDIVTVTERRVSSEAAEVLKCTEGNAFGNIGDRSLAQYHSELGLHDAVIERGDLNRIIRDRLADIMVRVRDRIPADVWTQSGMAVYLSGGTSLMRGIDSLAKYIYNVPVYLHRGAATGSNTKASYLTDPRYCTAIGLIRYAQRTYEDDKRHAGQGFLQRMLGFFFRSK